MKEIAVIHASEKKLSTGPNLGKRLVGNFVKIFRSRSISSRGYRILLILWETPFKYCPLLPPSAPELNYASELRSELCTYCECFRARGQLYRR